MHIYWDHTQVSLVWPLTTKTNGVIGPFCKFDMQLRVERHATIAKNYSDMGPFLKFYSSQPYRMHDHT